MGKTEFKSRSLLSQVLIGMAVGFLFFQLLGMINAILIISGTAAWFKQFLQGGGIPAAARIYLMKSTPIFVLSAVSNGVVGILFGGIWGILLWVYQKVRSRFPETLEDAISYHLASFMALPMMMITLGILLFFRSSFVKDSPPVTFWGVLINLVILLVLIYAIFRISRWIIRFLLRTRPGRFAVSRKGALVLTVCYGLFICLISFLPPRLASREEERILPNVCSEKDNSEGERPNILLLVLDTLRADHLSCYGYPRPTTPFLDQLAGEGVLFEHAYSPAVWTLAGHASIFTGMVPSKNGANAEHIYLEESFTTLAEILQSCGYRTAGFCNNAWVSEFTGMDQGFRHYRKMWLKPYGTNFLIAHGLFQGVQMLFSDVPPAGDVANTTKEVVEWIRNVQGEPFFVFINLMEPHPPLDYRPEYTRPFLPGNISPEDLETVNQNPYTVWAGKKQMDEKEFAGYRALYDGELYYMDTHLGTFFERLRSSGVLDNTLVIVTADHGEQMGEGGYLGHHFSLREALIHVPLIIRYPKWFPAGSRVANRVQTLDILPTILNLLGVQAPEIREALQGESLYPLPLNGERGIVAEEMKSLLEMKFVNAFQPSFDTDQVYGHRLKAYVEDGYKYVFRDDGKEEVFDIEEDSQEVQSVLEEHPDVVKRLRKRLQQWMASFEPFEIKEEDYRFQPDKATEERLRSLGYIQ